jgi:glycosidase
VTQFAERVEKQLKNYPRENAYAMYLLLGSHDTERILTLLQGEIQKLKLAFLFEFAYPGAPSIYYGDEIGILGGKDPGCRHTFPWDQIEWNQELRKWVQGLISLRKRLPVLRCGDFNPLLAEDSRSIYAFVRSLGEDKLIMTLNSGPTRRNIRLPVSELGWRDGRIVHDLFWHGEYLVSGEDLSITLEAWSGMWIM